jgi:uncharacterized protein YecT (DUF1311 family)
MILLPLVLAAALHQEPDAQRLTPEQRIESELNAKFEKPEFQTTMGQVEATDEATDAYKKEIQRVYKKLVKGLPPAERASLMESQRVWKAFEATECDSIGLIDTRIGSIHRTSSAMALKEFYRHRLEELNTRFDDFSYEEVETMPSDEDQPIKLDQWKKDHDRHRRPRLQSR